MNIHKIITSDAWNICIPAFLLVLIVLLAPPSLTGYATANETSSYSSPASDGSYISPTSDSSYKSPTSDNSYTSPTSDNSYKSPTAGEGYIAPKSDGNYTSPTIGAGYVNATIGPGYEKATVGPGFVAPTTDNYTRPEIGEGYKKATIGPGFVAPELGPGLNVTIGPGYIKVEIGPGFNGTMIGPGFIKMILNGSNETDIENITKLIIISPPNESAPEDIPITILNVSNITGEPKIGADNATSINLTPIAPINQTAASNLTENETIDKVKDEILKVLNDTSDEPQKENLLDANLFGIWRIYTMELSSAKGGSSVNAWDEAVRLKVPPTKLILYPNATWQYSSSSGTWKVLPIVPIDWNIWGMFPDGRTRKLVLENWNKVGASGPIDEAYGDIVLWVVYNTERGMMRISFGKLGGHEPRLSAGTVGNGRVETADGRIDCGNNCSAMYAPGDTVRLIAEPAKGWLFESWSGSCAGTQNECTIKIQNAHSVIAKFTAGCSGDSECPNDKACSEQGCVPVQCACGTVNNHKCQKFDCCSDSDCGEGRTCNSQVRKCIGEPACKPVWVNGDPKDKLDIVFVGDGFKDYNVLKEGINLLMDFESISQNKLGVFSLSPFKENKQKFNVWMVLAPDYKHHEEPSGFEGVGNLTVPDYDDYERFVRTCSRDTVIVSSVELFRSFANFPTSDASGGKVFLSLQDPIRGQEFVGRTLVHELGHAIGSLGDEYVEYGGNDYMQYYDLPNCATNVEEAKRKWGDLEGVRGVHYFTGIKDMPGTTYYKHPVASYPALGLFPDGSDWSDGGCAFVHKNIRPAKLSLMVSVDLGIDFGPVNEREIQKKIDAFTATHAPGPGLKVELNKPRTFTVTVTKEGTGDGKFILYNSTLEKEICGYNCKMGKTNWPESSRFSIKAEAFDGSRFFRWMASPCENPMNQTCSFIMKSEDINITARLSSTSCTNESPSGIEPQGTRGRRFCGDAG
ncbi:hypothetical protein HYV81_02385 [Candidatus Woesearchaeota archaeon]|nr:hypothetical protein [Candidatus Woesearchaeota archaeon]